MLRVEDALDALKWAASIGGLEGMHSRADQNLAVIADWVAKTPWVDFLAATPDIRSNTSVCLKVVDAAIAALP
jgi:phosphoserine aminotransferase